MKVTAPAGDLTACLYDGARDRILCVYAGEPEADVLAEEFAAASGYSVEEVPAESANAGFKDWFLQRFRRPGFTIEAGLGENPLPLTQLEEMVRRNAPLLAAALAK